MKTQFGRVLAVVLGLATTGVMVAQAGDRYVSVANGYNSINLPVPNIEQTFRELNRDGSGRLSMAQFWNVDRLLGRLTVGTPGVPLMRPYVTNLGPFWSYTDLTHLFLKLDTNQDGFLSLQEFSAINEIAPTFVGAAY